ncbi:Mth938-like domain-containing protein [Chloroflexota bacterium]
MGTMRIDAYRFGHLVVDGQSYDQDAIILPDRVLAGWRRKEGHALHREDLEAVFEARPEVLIVGQGAYARIRVTAEASQALESAGIEVIAQPTFQACQTYNRLRLQKSTAAALHLTC